MTSSRTDRDRPHFELRHVMSDGTEKVTICSLRDVASELQRVWMSRRGFVGLSAFTTAAALMAACVPGPTLTPTPTPTPTPQVVEARAKCAGLRAHTFSVSSVAISPDGSLLASGSTDNTVKLWQVTDGSLLRELRGHTLSVESVAFSPDGSLARPAGTRCDPVGGGGLSPRGRPAARSLYLVAGMLGCS
jgi:WD40 repeat protein